MALFQTFNNADSNDASVASSVVSATGKVLPVAVVEDCDGLLAGLCVWSWACIMPPPP